MDTDTMHSKFPIHSTYVTNAKNHTQKRRCGANAFKMLQQKLRSSRTKPQPEPMKTRFKNSRTSKLSARFPATKYTNTHSDI